VKKCSSFAEEEDADFEFWAQVTPDERIEALEEMRAQAWKVGGERIEGLRRVVRVASQAPR
jgi:hypothetical protein